MSEQKKREMPDIATTTQGDLAIPLDRVGMTEVQLPLLMNLEGEKYRLPAKAELFVNLKDKNAKGIHMSRLFLKSQEKFEKNDFSIALIKETLNDFLDSHKDLSDEALLILHFDLLTLRQALLSDYAGWRTYPVSIEAKKTANDFTLNLSVNVLYSSTCPCSAALSRQLIQDHFAASFPDEKVSKEEIREWLGKSESIMATPHSQRSVLSTKLKLNPDTKEFKFVDYIDALEKAVATPVQTAVKREDEQEFARLNASNLMFCEDAARKVYKTLDARDDVLDFWIKVDHKESLHPHNAVSITTKGIKDGFRPE